MVRIVLRKTLLCVPFFACEIEKVNLRVDVSYELRKVIVHNSGTCLNRFTTTKRPLECLSLYLVNIHISFSSNSNVYSARVVTRIREWNITKGKKKEGRKKSGLFFSSFCNIVFNEIWSNNIAIIGKKVFKNAFSYIIFEIF